MRITVCELPEDREEFEDAWGRLADHVAAADADVVLVPEMPFSEWLAATRDVDDDAWERAVRKHDEWIDRLDDLAPATVLGSRPTLSEGRHFNDGFVWTPDEGSRLVHRKTYLPDEPGYWEATWYESGDDEFVPFDCAGAKTGFMVCTDLWAAEKAREYGQAGAQLIANPRATELGTLEKWRAGARTMSVLSGAFLASSNRVGFADDTTADTPFGGGGWIIDPDGTVLAETSRAQPFTTVDVDLSAAESARETYPRPAFDERAKR